MDNNVVAAPRFHEIMAEFETLASCVAQSYRVPVALRCKRRVDFNQGVDARILAKTRYTFGSCHPFASSLCE